MPAELSRKPEGGTTRYDKLVAKLPHGDELKHLSSEQDTEALVHRVYDEIEDAEKMQRGWMLRRNRGAGKIGKKFQMWTNRLSDFLAAYSGIIEIVKGVAGEKAQIPYAAISILFIIAVNKTKLEEHIESTLKTVYLSFPGLSRICQIVDLPSLHPTLVSLTNHVVAYSQVAIRYYKRSSIARVWYAARYPPSIYLDKLKDDIEEDSRTIRNSTYSFTVEKLQHLVDVVDKLDRDRQRNEDDFVAQTKDFLNPKEVSETEAEAYHNALLSIQHYSRNYKLFSPAVLQNTPYKAWKTDDHSSLFILQGRSHPVDSSSLSWLSIAAFQIYEEIKTDRPECLLTRHFFLTHDNMVDDVEAGGGVADIIYQFIVSNPQIITNSEISQHLKTAARDDQWKHPVPKRPCEVLGSILKDDSVKRHPAICIFFDRVDRCTCTASHFVNQLLTVMQAHRGPPAIKVFMILGSRQRVAEESLELGSMEGRVYIETKNQEFLVERH